MGDSENRNQSTMRGTEIHFVILTKPGITNILLKRRSQDVEPEPEAAYGYRAYSLWETIYTTFNYDDPQY